MIGRIWRASKYLLFAGALVGGGLIAASWPESVTGSGVPATEDRPVGAVDEISLSGIGNLTITQGEVPSLSITADNNLLPLIETESSGRQLHIHPKSGYSIHPKTPLKFTLTVPKLEKVSLSGSGTLAVSGFRGNTLEIKLSGSGSAGLDDVKYRTVGLNISGSAATKMSGTAEKITIRVSGSGDVDARELKSETSEVRVSGSGTIQVWATKTLKARVSGSGDIQYRGNPQVEKRVSGSGRVKAID